ncbi:MAG: hypothetical protein AAGI01_09905, partial [Myxococcota bacterium]
GRAPSPWYPSYEGRLLSVYGVGCVLARQVGGEHSFSAWADAFDQARAEYGRICTGLRVRSRYPERFDREGNSRPLAELHGLDEDRARLASHLRTYRYALSPADNG